MKQVIFGVILISSLVLHGQSNLSFFHMQNNIPQVSNYNAAYFPNSKVYVSLPGLSGIDLSVNNSFGIKDVLTETGDSTLIDISRFLGNQKKNSFLNVGLGVTDLMVGVRIGNTSHLSFFVNERINASIFYPIDLMNFIWQGNSAYVGENFVADDMSYNMSYYREWGVGYAKKFLIANRMTTFGIRLKYLTGLLHSSSHGLAMSIHTSEADYSITAAFENSKILSAGIEQFGKDDSIDPKYFIHNGNQGFGIDLGGQFQYSEKMRFGAAINDIGFITWKDQSEQINLSRTSFTYEGINLDNPDEFGQAIQDSLDNIQLDTIPGSFNTTLNARSYLTADYQITKGGYVQATLASYMTQGKLKSSIGLGYIQNAGKWLSLSTTASLTPQQGIDIGAGLMLKLSVVQIYVVADNILNTIDIPNARSVNLKFGLNFLIGKYEPTIKMAIPKRTPAPEIIPEEVEVVSDSIQVIPIETIEVHEVIEAPKEEPKSIPEKVTKEPAKEEAEEVIDPYDDYSHLWEDKKKKKK